MTAAKQNNNDKSLYIWQNRVIHKARSLLCMDLDDCRELARGISGKASLSSLTLRQRWELIEILKSKGARVYNPSLHHISGFLQRDEQRSTQRAANPEDAYPANLAYWEKKFPQRRYGFASNKQLAWIQTLWDLDFDDGRAGSGGRGLRGFIFRQTKGLKDGPVSDLTFLRSHHVLAVLMPLKKKADQSRHGRE